jgi:hypothetical protein
LLILFCSFFERPSHGHFSNAYGHHEIGSTKAIYLARLMPMSKVPDAALALLQALLCAPAQAPPGPTGDHLSRANDHTAGVKEPAEALCHRLINPSVHHEALQHRLDTEINL